MNIRSSLVGMGITALSIFAMHVTPVYAVNCTAEGVTAFTALHPNESTAMHQVQFCGGPGGMTPPTTCAREPNTRDLYCCPTDVSGSASSRASCQDPAGDQCSASAISQFTASGTPRRVRVCGAIPPGAQCVPDSNTDSAIKCCLGSVGIPPGQQCPTSAPAQGSSAPQWTQPTRRSTLQEAKWWVPRGDLRDCYENGSCTLEQIMSIAASFANFLLTVSGSLLLLAFVVGGVYYLTSAGNASHAEKGKTMIVNAVIGMTIILLAGTIVRFVYTTLTPPTNTCGTANSHPGFVCQFVSGATPSECFEDGCSDGLKCCPITQTQPIDPMATPATAPVTPSRTP